MLKRVPIEDLQLGMYLHELCGAWLDHPFWRSKFVIRDLATLEKLRTSGVAECWVDTAKGLDVRPRKASLQTIQETPARQALGTAAVIAAPPSQAPCSLEAETARAGALVLRSKEVVTGLFDDARMGRAIDAESVLPLVDEIAGSVQRNAAALISLLRLKTHDDYTFLHSVAVGTLMIALARQMNLDEAQVREAGLAGMLHDVGKARIPLDVLNKPGRLTGAEYDLVKTHPRQGHALLLDSGIAAEGALEVCLHHHERPDGKGYPDGLRSADLCLLSRMGAVCDVYDAITSNRPYKAGWCPADSLASMAEWTRQGQFDPVVFRAFVNCVGIYPVGSLVRLQSERLAVVVDLNQSALTAPRVRVFYSCRSQMPVPVEVIDLSRANCGDRITGRESNDKWKFPFLDELVMSQKAPLHREVR